VVEAAFDQQTLATLIVGASQKIDVLWQIFIALHFGIFTLLLFNKSELTIIAKGFALFGYSFIFSINFGALQGTYQILAGLHEQLRKDFGGVSEKFAPILRESFLSADFSSRHDWLYATHGIAFAMVAIIIFGRQSLIRD
jgi:hypothetical protein